MTDDNQEQQLFVDISEKWQPIGQYAQITNCLGRPYVCGTEAACIESENNTSRCICPHDKSPPTADLKCPNRNIGKYRLLYLIYEIFFVLCIETTHITNVRYFLAISVPLTPKPIHNIIPPSGNVTNTTTALPEPEQVRKTYFVFIFMT